MNVLYIVCHDLGRHLGCHGALVESPRLDALAAEGVLFRQAHCSSTACSPSRMAAMTGLHAHRSGGIGLAHMGWPLPDAVPTVVDWCNAAGVETAHFGFEHERHPRGMRYQVETAEHWDDWDTAAAVDRCIAWLEARRDRRRPFYANIGTMEVHASCWDRKLATYGGAVPPERVHLPLHLHDTPELRGEFGKFHAAIRYMDQHIGRLLDALDRLGLRDDTAVIFTTDHGMAAMRSKGTLFDHGTQVSLIARVPGGIRGRVDHLLPNIDNAPTVCDLLGVPVPDGLDGRSCAPLLRGQAYQPHDAIHTTRNFHGEERIWGGQAAPDDLPHYLDRFDPVRSIRTGRFHYIRWWDPRCKGRDWLPWELPQESGRVCPSGCFAGYPQPSLPRRTVELYDLAYDPLEAIDVAERPEYAAIRRDLDARLLAWMRDTGDFALRDEMPRRYETPGWGDWPKR
jgi:arylsulfatase A-like enzyme